MSGNYKRVNGVRISRWVGDDDEPADEWDGQIEEMYREDGKIIIRVNCGGELIDVAIPIVAKESWNAFVDSLPRWD